MKKGSGREGVENDNGRVGIIGLIFLI